MTGVTLAGRMASYDGGGVTLAGGGVERSACVGSGDAVWASAGREVFRWGVKTRSGFEVADERLVAVGNRYWIVARIGPLRVREPVEVVAVVDEVDRKGFAYRTLEGHPIRGEEAFEVSRREDGSVWLTVRSLTRPATGVRRVVYPLARVAQVFYRRRYLRALR
ncbi:DUF1990 family protein [Kribbella sp. NPDC005582]|uniref:DUF1990 family protein n=1 Tax=Kribbella sp. NPDC005582 TaxID=3156893 RepID=UPI0033A10D10